MAFDRIIELSIGEQGIGTLISDLHVEFSVNRSITFAENTAEFTVYNAKEDTRKKTLRQHNNLIFKAGYADEIKDANIPTIFIGNIIDAKSFQSGPDWISQISAMSIRSSQAPLENTQLTLSYAPGTSIVRPLTEIGAALGLVVYGIENAQITLNSGFTWGKSARGALNYCKNILEANGASLYIDNTEIVIYKLEGRTSRFSAIYLDYESGLLNIADVTEYNSQSPAEPKRIEFESIIIPKLQPNGLININTEKLTGTFIIEKLTFEGDNFGGNNICRGEAVA